MVNCSAGNAKLPLPPMLMFDRITEINDNKEALIKVLEAELDIKKDLWFLTVISKKILLCLVV